MSKLALNSARNAKVLVVDDCHDSIQLMSRILENYHFDTTVVYDGQDSIPILAKQDFDLIVLDWNMPQMNGREMLVMMDRLISDKKVFKKQKLSVVIYTGNNEDLDLPVCENFNFVGFISKNQSYADISRTFSLIMQSNDSAKKRAA